MKVILLVPTYNASNRFKEWSEQIYALNPQPDKVIFVENNSVDNTLELARNFRQAHEVIRFWLVDAPHDVFYSIAHARQLLLTRARRINPDYAIFLDDDIYPVSKNMIERLTNWNKDLVGGSYIRRYPEGLWLASIWARTDGSIEPRNVVTAQIQEVTVTSGGCLCLSNKIIQDKRINFFPLREGFSEDFGYCKQARELGYTIWLDGTVRLGHGLYRRNRPWFRVSKNTKVCVDFKFSEQEPDGCVFNKACPYEVTLDRFKKVIE